MLGLCQRFCAEAFKACTCSTETFQDAQEKKKSTVNALVSLAFLVLVFTLVLVLGKWLWNDFLVKHITVLRPVKTVWQLVAIMVGLSLVMPTCAC